MESKNAEHSDSNMHSDSDSNSNSNMMVMVTLWYSKSQNAEIKEGASAVKIGCAQLSSGEGQLSTAGTTSSWIRCIMG